MRAAFHGAVESADGLLTRSRWSSLAGGTDFVAALRCRLRQLIAPVLPVATPRVLPCCRSLRRWRQGSGRASAGVRRAPAQVVARRREARRRFARAHPRCACARGARTCRAMPCCASYLTSRCAEGEPAARRSFQAHRNGLVLDLSWTNRGTRRHEESACKGADTATLFTAYTTWLRAGMAKSRASTSSRAPRIAGRGTARLRSWSVGLPMAGNSERPRKNFRRYQQTRHPAP